ncbi:DUF3950 domain-containing protein [Dongshaea marina]|uniref:DUF3950 domain-containing protein n=1 Tax=Dongshaea marina TaxID=2047966 RepID=UPI000D3E6F9B|nr:DUF3950 domain-containing protein [Dongshaea marina]
MSQVRTKKYYKQDNADRKQIRFGELLPRIQAVCGDNFSEWVKEACRQRLEREGS